MTYHCRRAASTTVSRQSSDKVPIRSAKTGCTFSLRLDFVQFPDRLELQPFVVAPHTHHEVGSLEDVQHLRPPAALVSRARELLWVGLKPKQTQLQLNKEIREGLLIIGSNSNSSSEAGSSRASSSGASAAAAASSGASSSGTGSSLVDTIRTGGESYLQSFTGRRQRLSLQQVKNIAKQVARQSRVHDNDVLAIEELISSWEPLGPDNPVLFYQPQQTDAEGNITQHFVLVLASSFGLDMINAFGAGDDRMVLLDATGGTNQYGYQLYGMLVVDEWREGVPCAFMITDSQEANEVQKFLQVRWCSFYVCYIHVEGACQCIMPL